MLAFAQAMHRACAAVAAPDGSGPVRVRVGLHVGPVVAAVVGTRMLRYHLFGEATATVSSLEQGAFPGGIRASAAFMAALQREGGGPAPKASQGPALEDGPDKGQTTWDLA